MGFSVQGKPQQGVGGWRKVGVWREFGGIRIKGWED